MGLKDTIVWLIILDRSEKTRRLGDIRRFNIQGKKVDQA
jgi:hypothetical protein